MKKIQLQINPIDRVFFRKNVNFTSDEISISLIDSRVLPTPPTIVGAIRYTAANKMGWKGRGDWPNSIKEELGDRDNLGKLDFYGPHILHRNEEKATMNKNDNAKSILFKLPSHIIGKLPDENEGEDTAKISSLKPGPAVLSNLSSNQDDKIRLLTSSGDVDEFRSLENYYISNDDMLRVLKGEELNEIKLIPESSLISLEEQIGINLDYKNKSTSKDHSLFSRTFVRLGDDCSIFEEV
ncbi:MAG: hypothetical protein OEZ01_08140, partial [Candidatus Heimdallarchaeota archaeon]|nr:hypothetical protein [Candidatus Heimdallarchaeota archaeon]